MAITTDRLLSGIKRRVTIPANQSLLSDQDILELSDDIVRSRMTPLLISVSQDYFVTTLTQLLTPSVATYPIPKRAVAQSLRDLKLMFGIGGSVRDITLLAIEDAHMFSQGTIPLSFYFTEDSFTLVPTVQDDTLYAQIWIELRPNRHVTLSNSATVTGISAGDVTVSTVPSNITNNVVIDFIAATGGARHLAVDKTVTNVAGTTLSFAVADVPTDLAIGDFISLAQTTPVVQLPEECQPLLESLTARRVLQSISDFEGLQALTEDISEEQKALLKLLEPRIRGETTKIINRRGLLRGVRSRYRRGLVY